MLEIQKAALIYARAINKNIEDVSNYQDSKRNLFKLILRDNMAYFPVYYELLNYWSKLKDNQLFFTDIQTTEDSILETLSKYYFFRRITGRQDKNITRDIVVYFRNYKKESKEITLRGFEKFLSNREIHDQRMPNLENVIRALKNVTYKGDKTLLKHILIATEIEVTKEETAPLNLLKHPLELEHILPQESNLWRDQFLREGKIDLFNKWDDNKDNIENIALLTQKRNREIKNSVFQEKIREIWKDNNIRTNAIFKNYNEYNNKFLEERMVMIITNFAKFYGMEITNPNDFVTTGSEIEQTLIKTETDKSNFEINDKQLKNRLQTIEKEVINGDYTNTHSMLRACLEYVLGVNPGQNSLNNKIRIYETNKVNDEIISAMHDIRRKGNKEVHSLNKDSTKTTVVYALENFHKILVWKEKITKTFNPNIYHTNTSNYEYKIDSSHKKSKKVKNNNTSTHVGKHSLKRLLTTVGKKNFVKYYDEFNSPSYLSNITINENISIGSAQAMKSAAKKIFELKMEKEALEQIAFTSKVDYNISSKAKGLLKKYFNK